MVHHKTQMAAHLGWRTAIFLELDFNFAVLKFFFIRQIFVTCGTKIRFIFCQSERFEINRVRDAVVQAARIIDKFVDYPRGCRATDHQINKLPQYWGGRFEEFGGANWYGNGDG